MVMVKAIMPTIQSNRLLTYSPELENGLPLYVSSNCFPMKAQLLEPAGSSFHAAALRSIGYDEEKKANNEQTQPNEKHDKFKPYFDSYSKFDGNKKSGGHYQHDHYSLLGLGNLRYLATEDQIRRSYREAALRHHPDKQASILLAELSEKAREAKKEEIEQHFKSIQEAYEVLIDPVQRRIYDSTDEFDDDVPSDCAPKDYFKVFGPVFARNGRWSLVQPFPVLGDDDTPVEDVDYFFDFWYGFKSWREFPHADDFDLEQADSREHKRWMERQNAKLREKAKKEEYARIRSLVDNAYKRDPRLIRRKEEEKKEKLRKKEAKLKAKRMKEEEEKRIVEEERLRKEATEKRAAEEVATQRKAREKEKKLLRKERARLRVLSGSIVSEKLLGITEEDVASLCMSLAINRIRNLCGRADWKEGVERAQLLKNVLEGRDDCTEPYVVKDVEQKVSLPHHSIDKNAEQNGNCSGQRIDESVEQNGSSCSQSTDTTVKQIGSLQDPSINKTLEQNSSLQANSVDSTVKQNGSFQVQNISEGGAKQVESLSDGGEEEEGPIHQRPDDSKVLDSSIENRKPVKSVASALTTREDFEVDSKSANGNIKITFPVGKENGISKQHLNGLALQSPDKKVSSGGNIPPPNGDVAVADPQDEWSPIHEEALRRALKTFSKDTRERWDNVTAAVPSKTKNQCMKKAAEMKDTFKSRRN
eukprot:Gb_27851 [translate_table: standard]